MNKTILLFSCMTLLLSACNELITPDRVDDLRVYISASVDEAIRTRTPYVPSDDPDNDPDAPNDEHPLSAAIWASTNEKSFPDNNQPGDPDADVANYKVAYHTRANFESSGLQLLENIIYSKNHIHIYFIGLYPKLGWTVLDNGGGASYQFKGTEDLMYAHKEHGYYSSGGSSVSPTLQFHHLLTWLKFEIKAENEDVADIWGKIKTIKIRSKSTASVDLSTSTESDAWNGFISFTGEEAKLPLYIKDTDNTFPAVPHTIPFLSTEEVAYVMCAPVDASAQETDYVLEIETEYRKAIVPVNLKRAADTDFTESTMGKQFTLLLTFKAGNKISVAASVTDWKTGGISSGKIG